MKILSIKPAEHSFRVECHTVEDMHFLACFIHPDDLVSGETDRNIKPKQPGQKPFRLKMHLVIRVHDVSVEDSSSSLRVSGTIESGSPPEFVELRAQHSLLFLPFQPILVQKSSFFSHEIDRLRQHEKESQSPLYLGIVLDDEEAHLLQVSSSGLKELGKFFSMKSGKQFKSDSSDGKYYVKLAEIVFASPQKQIIIAGPGFAREGLLSFLNEHRPKGNTQAFFSVATKDVGPKGIREALSMSSITKVLGENRLAQEASLVEEVLLHLGKEDGLATYGVREVEQSVQVGAARHVLLTESFLSQSRERCNRLLSLCKQMGIPFSVVNEQQEHGKQLAGLGGIVSLLRYRLE
ncbi:MAG: hypothetical protein V1776_02050 [Candidatus Diapherotrites archaeon]